MEDLRIKLYSGTPQPSRLARVIREGFSGLPNETFELNSILFKFLH